MAKTLKVVVKERVSLGQTRYDYIGTLTWAEYTGTTGSPITDVSGAASALPAQFDHITFANTSGYSIEYVPGATPAFKVFGTGTAAKAAGAEVADGTDLKALAVTFRGVGS